MKKPAAFSEGFRATIPSAFSGVLLRFCAILLAMLLILAAASGESAEPDETEKLTWEERLSQARTRYNEETVYIYKSQRVRNKRGMINVRLYSSGGFMTICIYESLKITDEAEMEAILELITASDLFPDDDYGDIPFMKAQWIAHNVAHSMATGSEEQRKLIEAIAGERLWKIKKSSKELDLKPLREIPENQISLYEMIEFLLRFIGN